MTDLALAGSAQRTVSQSATRSSLRHTLSVDILDAEAVDDEIAADWRRLGGSQGGATLFQTPEMLAAWRGHFPPRSGSNAVTLVVRDRGRAVLIWPLLVKRRAWATVIAGAGAPIAQYDDILLDPACDASAAVDCALDTLIGTFRADFIVLERVREDSALRHALRDRTPLCCDEAAPFVDLSQGAGARMATLRPRVARQHRKRVKRLQKAGAVAFEVAEDAATAERWLREAMAMKRKWLRETGRVSRAFVKAETEECLADLARALSGQNAEPRMVVGRLTLDGGPAAIELGFCHRGVYNLYLRAFQAELGRFGPGNVLTQRMLEWCEANGVRRYDMMAPRSRNKREWQSGEVVVVDFAFPATWRGRLYIEVVLKRLIPGLRRVFYALPASLRSSLVGVALRA
jgi:CelD/BcsL family acetyltransferase involved in cellulose biosynthesis